MKKKTLSAVILGLMGAFSAFAVGRIQNEDIRSETEIVTRGGTPSQLINDTKIWVTGNGILKRLDQAIIDGDLSGGGGAIDTSDAQWTLFNAEASGSQPRFLNQLLDTYATSKGTYSNTAINGSRLALTPGQTSGNQERIKQVTGNVQQASGVTTIAAQALAPKATTIAADTVIFDGDVCEFFPVGRPVAFVKQATSDGELAHQYLKDPSNNVALLDATSCSYDSGPGESTLVVGNPDTLDLDFDLLAAAYPDNLRVLPFDYQLNAKAATAASYVPLTLKDANTTGTLRIPAEVLDTFTVRASTLTGSVIRHGVACSPNGTYCFGVALEQGATSSGTYHFYYSANAGVTWTKYAFTDAIPTSSAILEDRIYGYLSTPQVVVADNGKAFVLYHSYNPTVQVHLRGAYSDISAGSPAVTQSAATGIDAENSVGTAGYICANTTANRQAWLGGDRTDLSFIAVACVKDPGGIAAVRFFSNGGATYQNSDLATLAAQYYGSRAGVVVTGSGSAHRTFIINKNSSTDVSAYWYDQPSNTPTSSTTVISGDYYLYDCDATNTKGYCLSRDNATDAPGYFSFSVTGTPSFSAFRSISPQLDLDDLIGLDTYENSAGQPYNYGKVPGKQVLINPSNANNAFFMTDLVHTDGVARPLLTEVRNDTSFNGPGPSNTTVTGNQNQGYNAASQRIGQTFTATFGPLRTIAIRLNQVGDIAPGNTLRCDLYNTAGGVPTGSAIATSINTYEESEISRSGSYQHVFCQFNETLTVSNLYAVVLETTHPLSTTNFINIPSGAGYGGGNGIRWDGSVWNDTGDDLVFEVNGEDQYDLSKAVAKWYGDTNLFAWGTDSAISWTPTTGLLSITTKKSPTGSSAASRRQSGHTFKATVTTGNGSAPSSLSALSPLGYPAGTFQPGMVFQTQPGTEESSRKDAVTGAVSATEKAEDRSGMNATAVYTGVTYRAEAGCDSGQAIVFDASGDKVDYGAGTTGVYDVARDGSGFSIESQFVLDTLPSVKGFFSTIASKQTDGTGNSGWLFYVNASNRLQFQLNSPNSSTTGSTTSFTTGTVYRVKVTGDGSTIRLYVHDGSTWVEEAYSVQHTTAYDYETTTDQFEIGNTHSNTQPYDLRGALCYVKVQKGANDMVATGYTSQPEILHPINAGKLAAAEQGIGTGSLTINTGFNLWGTAPILGGSSAVVDSYEDTYQWVGNLPAAGDLLHYRIDLGRGSDRNQSGVYGTNLRFFKR